MFTLTMKPVLTGSLFVVFRKLSLRAIMAEWLLIWLRQTLDVAKMGVDGNNVATGMSDEEVREYLLVRARQGSPLATKFAALEELHKKCLNLGADWINQYIPHSLRKIDRVSFGIMSPEDLRYAMRNDPLMPRSRAKLAIAHSREAACV